jgi:FkbM family methyltransferase
LDSARYAPPTLVESKSKNHKVNHTILDIGAYIGASMLYFQAKFPGSRIIGVEQDLRNFEILNLNLGYIPSIQVLNLAMSTSNTDKIESDLISQTPRSFDHWIRTVDSQSGIKNMKASHLIDQLKIEKVDLLKVSCETSTVEVLDDFLSTGKVEALCVSVRTSLIENHLGKILDVLNSHGRLSADYDCVLKGTVIWNYPIA